jgi:hypothetical protein
MTDLIGEEDIEEKWLVKGVSRTDGSVRMLCPSSEEYGIK